VETDREYAQHLAFS